jgi:hypothetical protein
VKLMDSSKTLYIAYRYIYFRYMSMYPVKKDIGRMFRGKA